MASAKQIAWRKKFARMAKSGKFKKSSKQKKPYRKFQVPESDIIYRIPIKPKKPKSKITQKLKKEMRY